MPICPNKASDAWKGLVKDVKEKFNVDDQTADELSSLAFYRKGDIPTSKEAIDSISESTSFTKAKTIKENIKGLFNKIVKKAPEDVGYRMGLADMKVKLDKLNETRKEFSKRVSEYLKTNEKLKGKLSEKQVDAITRKALKIGVNEKAYNKFTDYVDKVIRNENYAQQVKGIENIQGKMKKTFAESESFMNRMKRVNVEDLSQSDLNAFESIANEYVNSQKGVGSSNYNPFDLAKNEPLLKGIEKNISDKVIADIETKYDVYDLSAEEANVLDEYMKSDDPDLYFQNLEDSKKKTLTDNINKIASYSQLGLSESLSNIDENTGETNEKFFKDNYGDTFVSQLKDLANADLSKITNLKDLATIIKTIDNSITNKTNSNIGNVHSIIKAAEHMPLLQRATSNVKKFVLNNFGKLYYDTPIVLKGIFGNREVAAKIRYYTGWDGITNAASKAETEVYGLKKQWDEFKKKNKIGDTAEEDAIMGIYSRLNDVKVGSEDVDFQNEKKQLESSIDALLKSDKQENKDFGKFLQAIYEQGVDKFNTHKEFVENYKQNYPSEVAGVEWISDNIWKKNEKTFRNHSESNLNRTYDGEARSGYHPKRYTSVRQDTKVGSPDDDIFEISSKKPQETGRSKDRILKDKLPDNKVVDYRFEYNTFKNHQEILFEIGSYHDKLMFSKMSESGAQWDELFGGNKNASFVSQTAEQQYKLLRYGKKNADRLSKTWGVSFARTLKNVGSAIGLARVSQIFSQTTPAINTMFQAGKHFYNVMTTKGLGNIELFNQSSIGARGLELGAIGRSESTESLSYDKLQKGFEGFMTSVSKATGRIREIALKPLSGADVAVAKKSFLAFYLKYMNEVKGIKVTAADLPTEHLKLDDARREAISYAQQAVDELQGVSNKSLLSELKRNDNGNAIGEIARTILMPFNNFASNTRARILEDAQKARLGNSTQRAEALKDLLGTTAEATAFSAVNAFVVTGILRYGLKSVMASAFGIDTDKEDTQKIISDKFKQFYTGAAREMLTSGFGGAAENVGISSLNHLAYAFSKLSQEESGKDYYQWLKEEPMFKPQYSPPPATSWYENIANNTGGYGIGFRTGQQAYEDISAGITGTATSSYGYEKFVQKGDKETSSQFSVKEGIDVSDQDKNFFLFLGLMEGMSLLGVSEQDITRSAQALKYDILRKNKPVGGGGSPFNKGLGGKGLGSKGLK